MSLGSSDRSGYFLTVGVWNEYEKAEHASQNSIQRVNRWSSNHAVRHPLSEIAEPFDEVPWRGFRRKPVHQFGVDSIDRALSNTFDVEFTVFLPQLIADQFYL